jgi:hypothetical protein
VVRTLDTEGLAKPPSPVQTGGSATAVAIRGSQIRIIRINAAWWLAVLVLLLVGCGETDVAVKAGWSPPFVPVKLSISSEGKISLSTGQSIVTPVGTFSLEEEASRTLVPEENTIHLIIRHNHAGSKVDDVFKVGDEEVEAVIDGRVRIKVTNRRIFIDATKGNVRSIIVRSTVAPPKPPPDIIAPTVPLRDPLNLSRHAAGWIDDPHNGSDSHCRLDSDGLHVGPKGGNTLFCVNQSVRVIDADISVSARLIYYERGSPFNFNSGYGIYVGYCGHMPLQFAIREDGTWYAADSTPKRSKAIRKGVATNKLRVIRHGSRFEFFVNSKKVGTYTYDRPRWSDSSECNAPVGFFTRGDNHVVFSNLLVKPVS